ncbi:MAG TPA: Asp23/Gls24 family envelope stress response protein [Epulopiscium sp.]|nr:Asp23/Gls24 family envelope stress response protein [Candidatus Epulonipiscium sp.]
MDDKNVITMESTDAVGQVQIADDVIAIIAEIAATEVKGVAGMGGTLTSDIVQSLSRKRTPKGVRVELNGSQVMLDITLIINYGEKIPEVTLEVQKKVKNSIEMMTGLEIIAINIHITGIHVDKMVDTTKKQKQKSNSVN